MTLKVIPPGGKPPDYRESRIRSDDYWENRARKENNNRGAPEEPYAPRYNETSHSTARELSAAPKETDTLELSEALKNLESIKLIWTNDKDPNRINRVGNITLNGKSATIEFTSYDNNCTKLKWGSREIVINSSDLEDDFESLIGFLLNTASMGKNEEISFTTE